MTIEIQRGKSEYVYRINEWNGREILKRVNRHNARWRHYTYCANEEEARAMLLKLEGGEEVSATTPVFSEPTLTFRQRAILYFIKGFAADYGYSPNLHEIAAGIGANSVEAVVYQLDRLQEMGLMTRRDRRHAMRSIVLVGQEAS